MQRFADDLTHAAVADTTDLETLRQLGVHQFTRAVVAIGTDLEASILTTSLLSDLCIPHIWDYAAADTIARRNDLLVIAGASDRVERFAELS